MAEFKNNEIEPYLCELADIIEYFAENNEPMEIDGPEEQTIREEPKPGPSHIRNEEYYDVISTNTRQIKKFNSDCSQIFLKLRVPQENVNFNDYLKNVFNKMINEFINNDTLSLRDKVGLTFKNQTIINPIYLSFRSPAQISADAILDQFERIVQSNQTINIQEPLEVNITKVKMPEGNKPPRRKFDLTDFHTYCKSKTSFITINNPNDNLCLPRALVVGIALIHKDDNDVTKRQFKTLSRKDCHMIKQKKEAMKLCRAAGVDINTIGGGIEALQKFQTYLSDYKIAVFDGSDRRGHTIIYKGNQASTSNKYIDLILHEGHYNVIKSVKGAFGYEFFCRACYTVYNHKGSHRCGTSCTQCLTSPPCNPNEHHINCNQCNRYFYGRECYENHLQSRFENNKSVCSTMKYCKVCKKIYSTKNLREQHKCDHHECPSCKKYVPYSHLCYIQPLKLKKEKNTNLFIFFDFETRTEDLPTTSTSKNLSYIHVPNYCVMQLQCDKCISDEEISRPCDMCGQREYKIKEIEGDELLDEFFKIIQEKSPNFENIYLWAHNGGGYDFIFLAEYMLRTRKWTPEFTMNGGKILTMKYEKLSFKDSLNFFHTKLTALPKMFGLEESKGYFPHYFNKKQNYNYVGEVPPEEYYGENEMISTERKKFKEWYRSQKENNVIFDFKKEMEKYCTKDVEILRKASIKFRRMFIDLLKVDPLTESSTIASACMRAFRSNFLKNNTIGLMPFKSYRMKENQSTLAVRYIKYFEEKYGVQLESAYRGFEKKIGKYYVDGYHQAFEMEKLNTEDKSIRPLILEIHGCYYHGCPKCFPNRSAAKKNGKRYMNMDMKYQNTKNKIEFLKKLPENPHIIEKWECEIYKDATTNQVLKKYLEDEKLITPILSNREAFFGGRTENFKTYYKIDENKGEKIRYLDVNSLYPFVNKYGTYPVGHPKVLIGDDIPPTLDGLTGVAKVKVLPPKKLYIPLLPVKISKKLSFTLCPTCTYNESTTDCEHSDEERMITGTYTIIELQKALKVGYKILEIYEIWAYESTQYNKETGQGGIFADYINLFLKIKQEASGFPPIITTEEEKQKFIDDLEKREGIRLEKDKIQSNPGLRSLSKLCLNSLWGKFGQRNDLKQTKAIGDPAVFLEFINDPSIEVTDIIFLNNEIAYIQYKYIDEESIDTNFINPIVCAHVTAEARLYLYSFLEKLQHRVLYCDTDSIIFVERPGDEQIETGPYLGQMGDEMEPYGPDAYITEFVSEGPKNYGYRIKTQSGEKVVIKVRGFTLNYGNEEKLNFEVIKNFVLSSTREPITIEYPNKIQRKRLFQIVTQKMVKEYKEVAPKRRKVANHSTLPFGYNSK